MLRVVYKDVYSYIHPKSLIMKLPLFGCMCICVYIIYICIHISILIAYQYHHIHMHYIEDSAVEIGGNSNKSSKDFTIVIIATFVAGLIIVATIVTAIAATRCECKKSRARISNSSQRTYHHL